MTPGITPGMTRTITACFDSLETARHAAFELAQQVPGLRGEVYDARSDGSVLDAMALPVEDAAVLATGFCHGGVVRVEAPDHQVAAAEAVLRASGATGLEERAANLRQEGAGDATEPLPTRGPAIDPGRDI